jgi:hypothetical protein
MLWFLKAIVLPKDLDTKQIMRIIQAAVLLDCGVFHLTAIVIVVVVFEDLHCRDSRLE